ncbi:EI24 domain-containing protein [Sulfurovum sp. bin170]|uniref:EI24 domain-containing protein n=1 Tax=Sulfurovum sp. bin170 TaxID=2695268 RepID=UPI0013DF210B|nr:EI24 domain-containing protein [Sulfurovum sp. bin170]NEW61527.1 EI24 domain-containing protein [Sulfurovum sp. bin170]
MHKTIGKTTRDILSLRVLTFIFTIGISSILIWVTILWSFWEEFENFVTSYLSWIPWEWAQDTVAYIATPFVGYTMIIITISILTSLFSESLLISLAKKHYPKHRDIYSVPIMGSIIVTLKSIGIFIVLFIILFPFTFIPVLGQVLMLYLWSILLKAPTVYDVGGLFINDKKLLKKRNKKSTLIAMIASLFNYIPILNIFAPIYAQIMFLHHILGNPVPK